MTLGDALRSGRSGNLDALRLGLAACVIVSHAWPLASGPGTPEPLLASTGQSLGQWAVGLFFFLSGLFIAASAERRSAAAFWSARARRLLPGLAVALTVTLALALASGAVAGPGESLAWFLRALTLVSIEHRLSGAFAGNPYAEVVNGPLWSLFHEVAAYVACFVFVRAGGTRNPAAVVLLVALAVGAALARDALPGRAATFAPLFAAFALGMAAHVFRDRLPLVPAPVPAPVPALVPVLVALALWMPGPLAIGTVGYCALAMALRAPSLRPRADVSYGLYIYGWPVAQTLAHLQPGIGPVALAVASLAATYPLAWASWHLVERPGALPRRAAA